MELNSLTAVSPVDGRYRQKVEELSNYFSEFGLIKYRLQVEVEYFISLVEIPLEQLMGFPRESFSALRSLYEEFTLADAEQVKEFERVTNHDIKALEYFLKERFDNMGFSKINLKRHNGEWQFDRDKTPSSRSETAAAAFSDRAFKINSPFSLDALPGCPA